MFNLLVGEGMGAPIVAAKVLKLVEIVIDLLGLLRL
jgi:hypothetical protein